jgi:hypothetical protein
MVCWDEEFVFKAFMNISLELASLIDVAALIKRHRNVVGSSFLFLAVAA